MRRWAHLQPGLPLLLACAAAFFGSLGCGNDTLGPDTSLTDATVSVDGTASLDAAIVEDAGAADADANEDATSNHAPCASAGYGPYFSANPDVLTATFDRLDPVGQTYLCDYLSELEGSGTIAISEPAASAGCVEPEPCARIMPTDEERTRILAAKYAHAIWLDHHGSVPWSLSSYSATELDGLFDPNVLLDDGVRFLSVVDYSPTQAWSYVVERSLVAETVEESIVAVIDDLRTTDAETSFLHGIAGLGDPVDTAYTLDEALRTWVDRSGTGILARISRLGCHSISRIALALLRSMNIPGVETHDGRWFETEHSTPTWPVRTSLVPHGDHLYVSTSRATPSAELLSYENFFTAATNTAVCGADASCLGSRFGALNAVTYPALYTTRRCCDPTAYGYASCSDYLTSSYATTLSASEIADAEASLLALCQ